jgi:hypothetical protein
MIEEEKDEGSDLYGGVFVMGCISIGVEDVVIVTNIVMP